MHTVKIRKARGGKCKLAKARVPAVLAVASVIWTWQLAAASPGTVGSPGQATVPAKQAKFVREVDDSQGTARRVARDVDVAHVIPKKMRPEALARKALANQGKGPVTVKPAPHNTQASILLPGAERPRAPSPATEASSASSDLFSVAAQTPPFSNPFPGVTDTGYIPPDVALAAGPLQVVAASNLVINVFDKKGNLISSQDLPTFFSNLGVVATNDSMLDPTVIYDPYISRFWLLATSVSDTPQRSTLLIALSNSSDTSAGWSAFQSDATLNGTTPTASWCDYPRLGIDAQAVYFSCNMYAFPSSTGTFSTVKVRVATKAQFVNNMCCSWWDFSAFTQTNFSAAFTVQPATMYSAAVSDGEFLVNAHDGGASDSMLEVWHLSNVQNCCNQSKTGPTLSHVGVSVSNFDMPPDAAQSGSTTGLDTGDTRLLFAFWQSGHLSAGQTSNCMTNSCAAYYQLDVSLFPTVTMVNDWALQAAGVDYYYPAVAANSAGNKSMVYARSSPSEYAGTAFIGIPSSSTCINCTDGLEATLKAGQGTYVVLDGGLNRWGDYFGAAPDPDGLGIWISGEFAAPGNMWGTEIMATYNSYVGFPMVEGVNPSSGTGATQTFIGTYSDLGGYHNLQWVQMLFAVATDGGGQSYCFVHYDVPGNGLWLYSDVVGFFVGPITPGTASNKLQGSLCAINTQASSVSSSGNTLTLNVNVVLKAAGVRNIYMRAQDLPFAINTGWIQQGTWNLTAVGLGTMSVSPSSGSSTHDSQQTFTLTYPDPSGFAGAPFGWEQFLVATATSRGGNPFCYVHYDRAGNYLWMYSGDVGFFLGPVTPGTASSALSSSACSVNTAGASVANSSGNLVLTVPIVFKAPMVRANNLYQRTTDVLNRVVGFTQTGTFTVN